MVVLTTQYLCSRKCMLGLLTAWRLRKPIVVLREADVRYGGLSARAFAVEAALYVARYGKGMSEEERSAIAWLESAAADGLEWHRNKQLKHAVLCSLAELIYHHSGGDAMRDGVTWFGRQRAAGVACLSRRLSRGSHDSSPGRHSSEMGRNTSPSGSSASSLRMSHVHLGLASPLVNAESASSSNATLSAGEAHAAAAELSTARRVGGMSAADLLREVPYPPRESLPLAPEDSELTPDQEEEGGPAFGAGGTGSPHTSPRCQIPVPAPAPVPATPPSVDAQQPATPLTASKTPSGKAPSGSSNRKNTSPTRASIRASIASLWGSTALQQRHAGADRPLRRMRLRDQLDLPQVRCLSPLLVSPPHAAHHPRTPPTAHVRRTSPTLAVRRPRTLYITPIGGHRCHGTLPEPALPASTRLGEWRDRHYCPERHVRGAIRAA